MLIPNFLKAFALCAFLLILSSCATSQKNHDEAGLRLRLGTSFLTQGNYPSAIRELRLAETLDPKNVLVINNLGLAYYLREHYELAAQKLEQALKLQPTYSEARNNYGRVLIELTRYDDAITQLKMVVNDLTYEDPAKAWVNLGLAYFRKGDFLKARDQFAEAIKANRDYCLGQSFYGRSLLELGQLNAAAQVLDNAVLICRASQFDEPHYFSGLTYYKLGKTSSAIARMEEVVKLFPQGQYAKRAESLLTIMKN
jgi:type IV pilus assembly protein PilF